MDVDTSQVTEKFKAHSQTENYNNKPHNSWLEKRDKQRQGQSRRINSLTEFQNESNKKFETIPVQNKKVIKFSEIDDASNEEAIL